MARQKDVSAIPEDLRESEQALRTGQVRAERGSAALAQLSPEQERLAAELGRQDAERELGRRGLKTAPANITETSLTADFSQIQRPGGTPVATPPAAPPAESRMGRSAEEIEASRRMIREAGYDPITGMVLDPDRYRKWHAKQNPNGALPGRESQSGWWSVKANLPKPLPCPEEKIQAATSQAAEQAYCLKYGMTYTTTGIDFTTQEIPAPEVARV